MPSTVGTVVVVFWGKGGRGMMSDGWRGWGLEGLTELER